MVLGDGTHPQARYPGCTVEKHWLSLSLEQFASLLKRDPARWYSLCRR